MHVPGGARRWNLIVIIIARTVIFIITNGTLGSVTLRDGEVAAGFSACW